MRPTDGPVQDAYDATAQMRPDDTTGVIRREEELAVATDVREAGRLGVRKVGGSISIPVFQEELVIEKRMVVRERVIVRKHTLTRDQLVEADLRKERVELEVDPEIADRVTHEERRSWGSSSGDEAGAPATTIQGGAA